MKLADGISVTQKVTSLMDSFLLRESWSLAELHRQLGYSKPTVLRLLRELVAAGYVRYDQSSRFYRPGFKILELANVLKDKIDVREAALPTMKALAQRTRETIQLIVPIGDHGVCVDKAEGSEAVRLYSNVGRSIPLHCGGATKAILAFLPHERVDQILSRPLERMTPKTVTDPNLLRQHLGQIRKCGFAFSAEELNEGSAGVGAPVFDDTGAVIAGLSIAGPAARFPESRVPELASLVLEAASAVSERLGYSPRTAAVVAQQT